MNIRSKILDNGIGLPLPRHQTAGAAGMDLYAAVNEDVIVYGGRTALIPCGFAMALPEGFVADVRPRSGLALKHSVTVLNSPGTIDCDYRGEVAVILINHGNEPFTVKRGDRIGQMVILNYVRSTLVQVEALDETERGSGGYGSTGVAAVS